MDDIARPAIQREVTDSAILSGIKNTEFLAPVAPVAVAPEIPAYLQETYYWAYLNPRNVKLLDREFVVRTILWQQHRKLQRLVYVEVEPGQSVMQSACVYGNFSTGLAERVGRDGCLDIFDVAEVQVKNARRKLEAYPQATVHLGNALHLDNKPFDAVCCFFLLHELPDEFKREAVNLFLNKIRPGGKVIFVDYHKPRWWHPLKLITSLVFDTLEPFAKGLWRYEVRELAANPENYNWRKETIFGDLFQKVVATPKE
jgi:ubiquinone/menaquinone biosynthesis C-methylase UbiE